MTYHMQACTCPATWQGYPSYCPQHNPNIGCAGNYFPQGWTWNGTINNFPATRLHPDDIEAVAQRVVELMRESTLAAAKLPGDK